MSDSQFEEAERYEFCEVMFDRRERREHKEFVDSFLCDLCGSIPSYEPKLPT